MKYDLVIFARHLLSPTSSQWIQNENQAICIHQGKIEKISDAPKNWRRLLKAKKYLDLSQHLVTPGFINAHTHLPMTLFRGLAEDMDFHQWLNEYILPIEKDLLNRDFVRVGAELAAWECIRSGTTCVNDMYYFTDVILDVLDKAGLRGLVSQTFMSSPTPDNKKQDQSDYKILAKNIKKFKNHSRLQASAGPHAPYTCTDDLLKAVRQFANDHRIPLHIHVSETEHEVSESLKQYKKTPVRRLYDIGLMNGLTSFAHGIHLTAEDIQLIAKTGCGVVHNPESNMKIKSGVCPVGSLLKAKIPLGLGTDGAASNNNLNMVGEMDCGIKLQKLMGSAPATAKDFFKMATLGSAQALGLDEVTGSLEVGKRADLIAFDLNQPHMMPLHDPVAQVVYSANGHEVTHTICEGKILFANGKCTTLNTEKIIREVSAYQNKIQRFLSVSK